MSYFVADSEALALVSFQRIHSDDVLPVRFGNGIARLPIAKLIFLDLGVSCGHIRGQVFSDVRNIDSRDKRARSL